MKSRWTDFNAYYNTFYNARLAYDAGVRLQENQDIAFNPARPIRAHPTPFRAGQAEFEKAIAKSSDVLRKYPGSKWADDALITIGRSFFQLGQFFSAEQKFMEILQAPVEEDIREEAVLWQARVFLETERPEEGIGWVTAQLENRTDWDGSRLAEIRIILAQLHVEIREDERAVELLAANLPAVRNRDVRARGMFLYGQLLERLGRLEDAYLAFDRVDRGYRDYELIYLSELRKGVIDRTALRYDRSMRHFTAMSRDDKHFDQIGDIRYEMARTWHAWNEPERAEALYKEVLYRSIRPTTRVTQALAHYGLGELNRDVWGDYALAAAYFDSSARAATDPELFVETFDATQLAAAYGTHTRLSKTVALQDSLIRLADMPRMRRDSVISELRRNRLLEYQERLREQQRQGTTVINTTPGAGSPGGQAESSAGFLGHRNPRQVEQNLESFQALWGRRPLVDHWRRMEVVRTTRVTETTDTTRQETVVAGPTEMETLGVDATLGIDLSLIPLTPEKRAASRAELAAAAYQLGSLFHFTLLQPDSATHHYTRVAESLPETPVAPQAMYSLADLSLNAGDTVRAAYWADRIEADHAGTVFHQQLAMRLGRAAVALPEAEPTDPVAAAFDSLKTDLPRLPVVEQATRLHAFAAAQPPQWESRGSVLLAVMPLYLQTAQFDSARSVLGLITRDHPSLAQQARVRAWADALAPPDTTARDSTSAIAGPLVPVEAPGAECSELDQPLTVRGGLSAFVDRSGIKALMRASGIVSADFSFDVTVDPDGSVARVVIRSEEDSLGLTRIMADKMRSDLTYFPPLKAGAGVRVACPVDISVQL